MEKFIPRRRARLFPRRNFHEEDEEGQRGREDGEDEEGVEVGERRVLDGYAEIRRKRAVKFL
jgi:hypothetical protein